MKKPEISERVRELRLCQGLSQEQLAEIAGLSLRTIQRIERGENQSRGDSIQRIAHALSVSQNEIIGWYDTKDKSTLTVLQLSQLGFIIFPLLGIIMPIIIWMLQKNKDKNVNETGKRIINFQITWLLILISYLLFLAVFSISLIEIKSLTSWLSHSGKHVFEFTFIQFNILIYCTLYLYNIFTIIINVVRNKKGKELKYRPALKFLR